MYFSLPSVSSVSTPLSDIQSTTEQQGATVSIQLRLNETMENLQSESQHGMHLLSVNVLLLGIK